MLRHPPGSTRTATRFPYTTLCRAGQFGRLARGEHQRRLDEIERPVEFTENFGGPRRGGSDDDAVGPLEVLDRGALAQELGIGGHVEGGVGTAVADDALHLRAGADRDRSEEHTSELQSLMRISYAVFCLKKKTNTS